MAFRNLVGFFALIEKAQGKTWNQPSLSVFATTWNMGDQNGSDENVVSNNTLHQWLFPHGKQMSKVDENEAEKCPDVFILATEEQRIGAGSAWHTYEVNLQSYHGAWVDRVFSFLNWQCNYLRPLNIYIGATSLMVFSAEPLTQVDDFTIQRGLLSVAGFGDDKGLAGIYFTHPKTNGRSIVAVAAHLAAHEGKDGDRKMDLHALKEKLQAPKEKQSRADATVFLAGDLNFRIANDKTGQCSKRDIQEKIESTWTNNVTDSYFSVLLNACDELLRPTLGHLLTGGLLAKYREAPITFPPTFKLAKSRAGSIEFDPKRAPAWTDRVLVLREAGVTMDERTAVYQSNEKVRGSDHMPVYLRANFKFERTADVDEV
eukprot:GEMP01049871.1.p1 GENE.GEMP01049871.1~~GEMP01049871.1.p1  ORF type:complete len:373 (+),score=81.90 GEMP01049871.1:103-1221(+)